MEYCIVLRTSNIDGAGTDADVEAQLLGASGESSWIVLDEDGDDREKGDVNIYFVDMADIGDVQKIRIRAREEAADPDAPDWHLDRVSIWRGEVPDQVKAALRIPLFNKQQKYRAFENALRALPETKSFTYDNWIYPSKFDKRGTAEEWVQIELP